jgi:hypothetical protein
MYREISDLGLFVTNLALGARSVQKRPRSDISLYRPRVRFVFVFVFKIYLDTVTIQQLQLIFNGPCYYNKNIKFTKNVKPTY